MLLSVQPLTEHLSVLSLAVAHKNPRRAYVGDRTCEGPDESLHALQIRYGSSTTSNLSSRTYLEQDQ